MSDPPPLSRPAIRLAPYNASSDGYLVGSDTMIKICECNCNSEIIASLMFLQECHDMHE